MERYLRDPKKLDAYFLQAKPSLEDLDVFLAQGVSAPASWVWRVDYTMVDDRPELIDIYNTTKTIYDAEALKTIRTNLGIDALSALVSRGWLPGAEYSIRLLDMLPPSVKRDSLYYFIRQSNYLFSDVNYEIDDLEASNSTVAKCRASIIEKISNGPFHHDQDNNNHIMNIHPDYIFEINENGKRIGFNVLDAITTIIPKESLTPTTAPMLTMNSYTLDRNIQISRAQLRQMIHKIYDLAQKCYPLYYDSYENARQGYGDYLYIYPIWRHDKMIDDYGFDRRLVQQLDIGQLLGLTRHPKIWHYMFKDGMSFDAAVQKYLNS